MIEKHRFSNHVLHSSYLKAFITVRAAELAFPHCQITLSHFQKKNLVKRAPTVPNGQMIGQLQNWKCVRHL